MTPQKIIILSLSLSSIVFILYLPVFASWRTTLFKYKIESLMLIGIFVGVFYLGGERTAGQGFVDTTRIFRIIIYLSIAGICAFKVLTSNKSGWFNTGLIFMTIYAVYAMLSASYSIDPLLTLWKAFEVLTHISVAGLLATRINSIEDAHDITGLYWFALTFIICALLWGALLYPDAAFRPFLDNTGKVASEGALGSGLRGTFPKLHLNSVTQIGAIISLATIALLFTHKTKHSNLPMILLLVASLSVMILGHSRTSVISFAIAIFVIGYYLKNIKFKIFVLTISVSIGITALVSGFISGYLLRGQTQEQFSSLTGRLDFWEHVVGAIMEEPLIGYGYYAGTRVLFGLPGVDNTYLNVLMGGGFLLFFIFIIPILIISRNLFFTRPSIKSINDSDIFQSLWTQTFGLFVILFLRSVTGPSFDANHFNLILFLLCVNNAHILYKFRYKKTITEETIEVSTEAIKDNILSRKKTTTTINKVSSNQKSR